MKISKVVFMYFSPTQSSKNVLEVMKAQTNLPVQEIDLTNFSAENTSYTFDESNLVVLGVPVYSGRVPKTAVERLSNIKGSNTPIALVTTYGNRDFDDALLELKTIAEEKGFRPISAAAVVTEHSIVHSIATGRPNEKDKDFIKDFMIKTLEKLEQLENIGQLAKLTVKGNPEYCPYHSLPLVPKSTDECLSCGLCALKCPVSAIPFAAPATVDKELCISCMRCVQVCPTGAKKISDQEQEMVNKLLTSKCTVEKQAEMFL